MEFKISNKAVEVRFNKMLDCYKALKDKNLTREKSNRVYKDLYNNYGIEANSYNYLKFFNKLTDLDILTTAREVIDSRINTIKNNK
jgi:hypothetical protein